MKRLSKIVAVALMVTASASYAEGYRGHGHHNHRGYNNWVAPLVIGGVLGYAISQPRTVYVETQPVYVERSPTIITYSSSARPPDVPHFNPNAGLQYEEKMLYDDTCQCYRKAYVEK